MTPIDGTQVTDEPVFELERFSAAPVSGDVAVVEVDGRFAAGALDGEPPRLLVESPRGDRVELPALAPVAGPDGRWHASFAVPADRLTGTAFALALRDLLLDLPAPDTSGADGDRLVALARELNALRRELDVARERAVAAEAAAEEVRASAEADKDRALGESAARMETALREARERHAGEQREADESVRRAAAERDEAIRRATAERDEAVAAAAAERDAQRTRAEEAEGQRDALADELREARRAQKTARADLEALRRERDGLARELERALKVIPKGREEPVDEDADTAVAVASDETDDRPAIRPEALPPSERTAVQPRPAPDPGEPLESVRVIGRQGPRRVSPADTLPPVDAELPAPPPIVRWIVAAILFVLFVVVATLLLL